MPRRTHPPVVDAAPATHPGLDADDARAIAAEHGITLTATALGLWCSVDPETGPACDAHAGAVLPGWRLMSLPEAAALSRARYEATNWYDDPFEPVTAEATAFHGSWLAAFVRGDAVLALELDPDAADVVHLHLPGATCVVGTLDDLLSGVVDVAAARIALER